MMATHSFELQPFETPTTVRLKMPPGLRQDGMRPLPELQLHELSRKTVEELCAEFTSRVLTAWDQHAQQQARDNADDINTWATR